MGLLLSFSIMLIAWFIYLKTRNPALIDIFWGLNIGCTGVLYLSSSPTDALTWAAFILLIAWSARLSGFLWYTRCFKKHVDPRYQAMARGWRNQALGFLGQYLLQGCLAWLIALPFFTLQYVQAIRPLTYLSIIAILIGLVGETIADLQLQAHKQRGNKHVLQQGLWHYSRHPNYFFECVVWLGFSLMGASVGPGMLAFVSFLTLFSIMWFVTIPLTEAQSLKRRKDYRNYIKSTSCLIPWQPKA